MAIDIHIAEIQQTLDHSLGKNLISRSAYDTARVAQLYYFDETHAAVFPESIEWVINNQNPDGSWGEDANGRYLFDKHLATLAAIAMFKHWGDKGRANYDGLINSGLDYLHGTMTILQEQQHYRPVAFELIFPTLIEDLTNLGFQMPLYPSLERILAKRREKLLRIPATALTAQHTTAHYSLEGFRGMEINWFDVLKLQDKSGSFSSSPSSSAFMFIQTGNKHILDYLRGSLKDGAAPANWPFELYERVWSIDVIVKSNLQGLVGIAHLQKHLDLLSAQWRPDGMTWTREFHIPDLDNTAQLYYIFNKLGMRKDESVWQYYMNKGKVICYPGENDAAPSHLLHLIQTLDNDTWDGAPEMRERCLQQIEELVAERGFYDKWHASEFYTLHILIPVFLKHKPEVGKQYLEILLSKQKKDGSWGTDMAAFEETALSCYGMILAANDGIKLPDSAQQALQRGIKFLSENYKYNMVLPPLWISKVLYINYSVIKTLIHSVLASYDLLKLKSI